VDLYTATECQSGGDASTTGNKGTNLEQVGRRVVPHILGRAPGAAVDHGVEGALVEGGVDGAVGEALHVAHVQQAPLDALGGGVAGAHEVDDGQGEVDAELAFVAMDGKVDGD